MYKPLLSKLHALVLSVLLLSNCKGQLQIEIRYPLRTTPPAYSLAWGMDGRTSSTWYPHGHGRGMSLFTCVMAALRPGMLVLDDCARRPMAPRINPWNQAHDVPIKMNMSEVVAALDGSPRAP